MSHQPVAIGREATSLSERIERYASRVSNAAMYGRRSPMTTGLAISALRNAPRCSTAQRSSRRR